MTRVLVLNTGSSSLKWTVFDSGGTLLADGNEAWGDDDPAARQEQIRVALRKAPAFDVAGHRVVHGGPRFRQSVRIDDGVLRQLREYVELNPEHMTVALAGIDAVSSVFPQVPQVAAFDTAFHATLSEAAAGYALPFEWTERWKLRRYGFHGLSVAWAVRRTRELLGRTPDRMIVCHLGSGCSVTAVREGRSVDTTMGFSPLEGLVMATRSGSIDPGLLLHLQEHLGVGIGELRKTLTRRSGLLGMSGVSGDLREVLAAAESGSVRARLAYERFVRSLRQAIGAMAAVLEGADVVVFTGGIGENSAEVRRDAAGALAFAGLEVAGDANVSAPGDSDVSAAGSVVRALVVRSREDLVILEETLSSFYSEPRSAG